jgi:hypothetical protein
MPLRRRNPQGALILQAISALLVVNDAINIASSARLDLARKIKARGLWYFHHGLLSDRGTDPDRLNIGKFPDAQLGKFASIA